VILKILKLKKLILFSKMSLQEMLAATLECPVCLEVPKTGKNYSKYSGCCLM
jgi:hypothetical protein